MKRFLSQQNEKGITLIALVITIVVLLILAGVSISMLSGENGIIKQAQEAKLETRGGAVEEFVSLWKTEKQTNEVSKIGVMSEEEMLKDLKDRKLVYENEINKFDKIIQIGNRTIHYGEIINNGDITIPEDAVARIDTKYYTTLQSAIDDVENNNEIKTINLLKDISENVTTSENQNIILDLDGKTVNNENEAPIITINNTITIKNGNIMGSFNSKIATILVNEGATLTIEDANLDRISESLYSWETIELRGNLIVNSGRIYNPETNAICAYEANDSIYINGGRIESSGITIYSEGVLEISGGRIESSGSTAIYNLPDGECLIAGGTICGNDETIYSRGLLTINGGIISAESEFAIQTVVGSKKIVINDGTIYSENGVTINSNAVIDINGGVIYSNSTSSTGYTIRNCSNSILNINGGEITHNNNNYVIYNYYMATVNIAPGITITGKTNF